MEKLTQIHKYIEKQIESSVDFESKKDANKHKRILKQIDKMLLYYMDKLSGIENLDLSTRQFCRLKRANIDTISQLGKLTKKDLLQIENLSEQDIYDLIEKGYINNA